ncbi:MAG: uroporphyrinogen decarboxylase family protein [Archangium sp.]|nr:uroporphyrinogen decarboxylase family protein [Archangium sp.]
MTPLERTRAALSHREGDRPPIFLLFTNHGARELGLDIAEYCSKAAHLVEGQLRLRAKFGHDCLYAFFHAAVEHEAWGGHTRFIADGPPNSADLLLQSAEQIPRLEAPVIADQPGLQRVLRAITALRERSRGEVPVLGVVLSPFSVPVMQLGFSGYLDLLLAAEAAPGGTAHALLERLLAVNADFAVRWGNAQLAAGATAVAYFDPLSSSTITSPSLGAAGLALATRVLARLNGPAGLHFASGKISSRLDAAISTGAALLGVSAEDDLADLKRRCAGKVALLGNLDGVQMVHWTPAEAALHARRALDAAARGGGFILADNHGEIPFQVGDEVLHAIVETTARWTS